MLALTVLALTMALHVLQRWCVLPCFMSMVPLRYACPCSKGATLGCFKLTCRASYHLACARKYKCMLQASRRGVCPQWLAEGAASLRCGSCWSQVSCSQLTTAGGPVCGGPPSTAATYLSGRASRNL